MTGSRTGMSDKYATSEVNAPDQKPLARCHYVYRRRQDGDGQRETSAVCKSSRPTAQTAICKRQAPGDRLYGYFEARLRCGMMVLR